MTRARAFYMAELRAAIAKVVVCRDRISLAALETELPAHFPAELPGRVTLAKAITGMGWSKIEHSGPGTAYRRQSGAPAAPTAGAPANPQPFTAGERS